MFLYKADKRLVHGAYDFIEKEGGYVVFSHYSKEQQEYLKFNDFFYVRAYFTSSVTIEAETAATKISLFYKFFGGSSKDTFALYVNGKKFAENKIEELSDEGTLVYGIPEGKKRITLYFPIDTEVGVKEISADEELFPITKKPNVLFIGDSITQGYGTFETDMTYVNVLNRTFEWEILNQGVGGYYFDEKVLTPLKDFVPEKIIVAMGTNLHSWHDKERYIYGFFKRFGELYGDIPALFVTPLWRNDKDFDEKGMRETYEEICSEAKKMPKAAVIDGFGLVPHDSKYFYDGLHPNAVGAEIYGTNLAKKIKAMGF